MLHAYVAQQMTLGKKVKIDLFSHSLKIGKEYIIRDGVINNGYSYESPSVADVEDYFGQFYYSRPQKTEVKSYFQALPLEELSADDLLYGSPREMARVLLELTVLELLMDGFTFKGWFWQSEKWPQLVLLKSWTKGE